ncbi:MAG: DAK2 domain-containing protein [Dehalococcoidia bacterium]
MTALDGRTLRLLFSDALKLLQRHIEALNAINVFPVPDGDTGTNMHLTLRAGIEELDRAPGDDLPTVAHALAHGTLMGARGNSGVILSQVLRGFAEGLDGEHEADGRALSRAFGEAAEAAYGALSEPREGTILTVVRQTAEAVASAAPATAEEALTLAASSAREAVERTPELLPVLKEAGVVDAGGLGLAIVLEGLRRSLAGEPLDVDLAPQSAVEAGWRSEAASLHRDDHGEGGYCTEFMVSAPDIDLTPVRERLGALGTSLLVVGRGDLLRVHVHTSEPDDVLAYGRSLGEISQVKVDNLEAQITEFFALEPAPPVSSSIDVVAVAAGEGIDATFRSVGVTHLVEGGQTMNPSAGEILAAIDACPAGQVVVLPNNKNIVAAARQAAERSSKRVAVVPTRSVPQGIAAVLALSPDLPFESTVEAMERALTSVRSAEVTRAVRATTLDGRRVAMGQAIAIVDGKLEVVADDLDSAVQACVEAMRSPESSLLTIYAGRDVREEDAEALAVSLRERYPDLEVDLVRGEQPHYPYLLSLE